LSATIVRTGFARLSVNHKLRVINIATTGVAFLLAALVLVTHLWSSERGELQRNAEAMARVMAQNSAAAFLFDDSQVANEIIGALARDRDVVGADLLRLDGHRLATFRRGAADDTTWAVADYNEIPADQPLTHFHTRHLDIVTPVVANTETVGTFRMRIDLTSAYGRLTTSISILLTASLAAMAFAIILLNRLQQTIVEPLGRLLATMRRVSVSGDYTQRTDLTTRDEIGALGDGFNHMICQIEARDDVLEHELSERRRTEDLLRHSEARYRTLFADSQVVMLIIEPGDGSILDANAAACRYYGYPPEVFKRMNIAQINLTARTEIQAAMQSAAGGKQTRFDFRHRLASGEIREVSVSSGPVDLDGQPVLLSVIEDITEQRRAEHSMREALVVFNASSQGILTTDAQGVVTATNPAFSAITGYAGSEVVGRRPARYKSGRQNAAFYAAIWTALLADGEWHGEIWNRRKSGEVYLQWLTITAVRDEGGQVIEYVAMFSDITERKRHEEKIWRQANFDALTGLANRNLFHEHLEHAIAQALRSGRKLGLMFLDLDGFKWINDTLGHDVGDELLVEVAHRLQHCVREQDTVARLGGDEFTLLINELVDADKLVAIGEKLVNLLREPFALGGGPQHVSGSIGITVYPDDGGDVQTLLKQADIAMYNAKQAGKNRFRFYAQHMQDDAQLRMRTEAELRAALTQQEFALYYQPIVDTVSGALTGAEALIRWHHPRRGLVAPAEFIPIAEDCGLIAALGEWVIREAARQCQCWQAAGWPVLRLAVNVSPLQFRERGLPGLIAAVLDEFPGLRGRLLFEITESALMDGSSAVEERMEDIRKLGIGYALDDFGTGFSSLSHLRRFPVDVLKIDCSFISACTENPGDAHLVRAIINMAHGLDIQVTAEGVETEAQLKFLRELACDFVQGALISLPLPAAEFERLLRQPRLTEPARHESACLP
jgi:diguanylate cyclase (GGDEF)-like protein/PAS domain S-box-containing protein